jgi:hypothetical protein
MLSVIYAECHFCLVSQISPYAECHYAECRHAECRFAECSGAGHMLSNLLQP